MFSTCLKPAIWLSVNSLRVCALAFGNAFSESFSAVVFAYLSDSKGWMRVALLAAAEVGVDRLPVEDEPRREAGEDRHERRPVRLACRRQIKSHAGKPSALRMTSTGAGTPVQSSNDSAPWATSTSTSSVSICWRGDRP